MNLIRFILIFGVISLSTGLIGEKLVYGEHINALIEEDEAIICLKNTNEDSRYFNTESCKVIKILDLLTDKQEQNLSKQFGANFDIDTFPFGVATN